MRAIMVMFDSLNRRMLPPYGCDWVHAPSFERLAEKTVTFTNAFVGSMPCMPARRELHTGRYNFLHRAWGPLEPFDDSMPQMLDDNGVHSHLCSDHYHYWEDGGATYHNRYSTWRGVRGQEGDFCRGDLTVKEFPEQAQGRYAASRRQDIINRGYMQREEEQPQAQTFGMGLEFMRTNQAEDNWFLQIETFDPHEPFFTLEHYKELYEHGWDGPLFDWPHYGEVTEAPSWVAHMRMEYAALVSMCDNYLGKVLDAMDEMNMWEDTMLIVNTDHGFLLGEHDYWAKCSMPFWNEVANMPLFMWDPRTGVKNETRDALVQTIDIAPTVLEYFGIGRPEDMEGVPLRHTIEDDSPVREAGLFGIHGGQVNVTDGRYVYMRGPVNADNTPLSNYTLMCTHMRGFFGEDELADAELVEPLPFTKNMPVLKTSGQHSKNLHRFGTLLYDLKNDPGQIEPIENAEAEERMIRLMVELMKKNDAPLEQFVRLGLEKYV